MTDMVKVINNNEAVCRGRFDGKDYVFEPGKPTYLTLEAAGHIFGLGVEDKSQALNMLGWLVPGRDSLADALKKLDRISFLEGKTVYEDDDEQSESPTARGRGKTGGRPHVSGPGGEPGAGAQVPASANL
jgi:hypothetical protein